EDAGHVVWDAAHDEAVEQRDRAAGAGAGDHPPRGQELEALQRLVEAAGPGLGIALGRGQRAGNPPPRAFEIGVAASRAIAEPVLHVPDALGNRGPIHWRKLRGAPSDINKNVLLLFSSIPMFP